MRDPKADPKIKQPSTSNQKERIMENKNYIYIHSGLPYWSDKRISPLYAFWYRIGRHPTGDKNSKTQTQQINLQKNELWN